MVLCRRVQGLTEGLGPGLVFQAVASDGRQEIQVDAVDVALAGGEVRLQRRQGQQGRPAVAQGDLRHGLGQILVALHGLQMDLVLGGLVPVPVPHRHQVPLPQVDAAEHGVEVGQEALLVHLDKTFAQRLQRSAGVQGAANAGLVAHQHPHHGKLDVRGDPAVDVVELGHEGQHPVGDVLALFKLALGYGAVRQAYPVLAQDSLYGEANGLVEQIVFLAPGGKILTAV